MAYYNRVRVHDTLRVTPAMQLGVADHVWSVGELVTAALAEPVPQPPPVVWTRPEIVPDPVQLTLLGVPHLRPLPGGRSWYHPQHADRRRWRAGAAPREL